MLIIYDKGNHETISISGIRGQATREEIDSINVVELPGTQAEYRIYDSEIINQVWTAMDSGEGVEFVFDGNTPTGIQIVALPDPEELIE